MTISRHGAAALLVCTTCLFDHAALADEIFLKNGDHITGKIVSAEGGSVVVTPDFDKADNITLSLADIASFTTSGPIVLKLADGTVINQPVVRAQSGQVSTAPGGTLVPQQVSLAQIDKINPNYAWTGSVGVNGMYSNTGTTSKTLGLSVTGTRRSDNDRITASADYNYGEQTVNGITSTSANNWAVMGKYDYFISKSWYSYATTGIEADRVNFLTLQLTPGVGGGYQWVDQKDFHLDTEGGLSWVYSDYSTNPSATKSLAARVGYNLDKSWDDGKIKIFNDVDVFPSIEGARQFLIQGDAGLQAAVTKSMYSQVKVNVNYDSEPAPGAAKTSSQFLIGLGMNY